MSDTQKIRIEKFLARTDISVSERSFGESLNSYWNRHNRITNGQWSAFQRMAARYSPEVIAQRQEWYDAWDEEKAKNIRIAAEYYSHNPPYFENAVGNILADENYIPSRKLYSKMVENKYVQTVIKTIAAEPLYGVGTLVQVTKTAKGSYWRLRDQIALVVDNSGPVTSATRGAKTYSILPFGETAPIKIQERWLKKKRG